MEGEIVWDCLGFWEKGKGGAGKGKGKKPQPEEVEQYSGMRVEVMTAEERLLFVAKLQEIRGTTARLYQYSDGDVFQKEETINVKIRGYSDQDAKAVYLEGAVTPEENLIWRVEDLTFVKIGNDRAFFRLDTDLEASITPVGKISFAEEPARLLNISVGGACWARSMPAISAINFS